MRNQAVLLPVLLFLVTGLSACTTVENRYGPEGLCVKYYDPKKDVLDPVPLFPLTHEAFEFNHIVFDLAGHSPVFYLATPITIPVQITGTLVDCVVAPFKIGGSLVSRSNAPVYLRDDGYGFDDVQAHRTLQAFNSHNLEDYGLYFNPEGYPKRQIPPARLEALRGYWNDLEDKCFGFGYKVYYRAETRQAVMDKLVGDETDLQARVATRSLRQQKQDVRRRELRLKHWPIYAGKRSSFYNKLATIDQSQLDDYAAFLYPSQFPNKAVSADDPKVQYYEQRRQEFLSLGYLLKLDPTAMMLYIEEVPNLP